MAILGLDIGTNSVGSAWIDNKGKITTATSIFPAGVDESDEKRGEPKNVKRRMTRHARVTLARRAERKRLLRAALISAKLLPSDASEFQKLLAETDPWSLRRTGLDKQLTAHEFGRVLLHLAQRRGALGLKLADPDDPQADDEDGKVKAAIGAVRSKMQGKNARTFGEFISIIRDERVTAITNEDRRPPSARKGPREYRDAIRNKAGKYEHCADRQMIHAEFSKLWDEQKRRGGALGEILTDKLRLELDNESGSGIWRQQGLLFGQRRTYWDTGTLGRCDLEPTERCAPHADMYASQYLVVETVNNLKIIERGKEPVPLTPQERDRIKCFLSGPLGMEEGRKKKGETQTPLPRKKTTVSVTDLRNLMGTNEQGWGRATKTNRFRFNIESDDERVINTDWFSREIIHGAVTPEKWGQISDRVREGINSAILKFDPDDEKNAIRLKTGVMEWSRPTDAELKSGMAKWEGLSESQADALVVAWKKRPKPDAKRLNMSRRAVRNILTVMDREPMPAPNSPGRVRWLTQIEARKLIAWRAENEEFKDATTGKQLDERTRHRYATGAKGATARDRHYMQKHLLKKNGELIFDPDGLPLAEPPPAPLISNPVVRKAIHEVRRHLIEYMTTFECRPRAVYVELAREAKMGKKDSDILLFRNRLRNRIRNDIAAEFDLYSKSSTQMRAAVDRIILCVHQRGICPLCGNQLVTTEITTRMAADGDRCEVAHVIPKAGGGHNGLGNIVLAHTKCNRDMGRRTPRQFWDAVFKGGFDEGIRYVEGIFTDVDRPKPSDMKNAKGDSLWSCYFSGRPGKFSPTFDELKIAQFKKDIKDIQQMTDRQGAATKYATRQVMAYLADALFDGTGLPERGGPRKIHATDGMWTARLRREWRLFFDPHEARVKGLNDQEEHFRKEKNRGDHRHHAVDAVITALCTDDVKRAWEKREKDADQEGIPTASEEAMESYRRRNPLDPPTPFHNIEQLKEAVRVAVFGDGDTDRPISHRPVKRKLIGAFHEETLFGTVPDDAGKLTDNYTAKKNVLALDPNHLRLPRPETEAEAIDRLAARAQQRENLDEKAARKWARVLVSSSGYKPAIVDPSPGKPGLVRDVCLRKRIRDCISNAGFSPDGFSAGEIKRVVESGGLRHVSGVPIKSVVLLRTMSDPVIVSRWATDHATGKRYKLYDGANGSGDPAAARAYVGGNNHHIEIRVAKDKKGKETWSGRIVTSFEAAQRKIAKLRAFRAATIPNALRRMKDDERAKLAPTIRAIENTHGIVDRSDNDEKGGKFVMSLCEGEMIKMRRKNNTGEAGDVGFFVVAKLDKPQSIVLVPHWDARPATGRKDSDGNKVPDSKREQFAVTPTDLRDLAPPGRTQAVKVRVSPLGVVTELEHD